MATEKIRNVRVERGPKNLSSVTHATTDLYKIQPILARETKKDDVFNIMLKQINICDALSVPSFINVRSFNTFFYVPYAKVWQSFETLLGKTSLYLNGNTNKFDTVPVINKYVVWGLLNYLNWISYVDGANGEAYDFRFSVIYDDNTSTDVYARLNSLGRKFWNILLGLGYRFDMYFQARFTDSSSVTGQVTDYHVLQPSMLPLYAYAKIYFENYCPSKYADRYNQEISRIYNDSNTYYNSTGIFSMVKSVSGDYYFSSGFSHIVSLARYLVEVFFGDDYFTSSPAESMASPDGLNDDISFSDITKPYNNAETLVNSDNNNDYTPVHQGLHNVGGVNTPAATPFSVSDYIHNMLHVLTKNIQLKALAGSKLSQRLYALYGSKSQVYNMQAVCLGQDVSDVDVKAITALGDTSMLGGPELGQKGGQLNNYSEKKFHAEFTEFGLLVCVNAIIPSYFYGQGMHREMMHIRPEDFYNDRFALAGYQNIGNFELFADDYLGYYARSGKNIDSSFGKTSAYAEYALRKDVMMGDFAILSRARGLDAYHNNRFLVDQVENMSDNEPVYNLPSLPDNNEDFLKVVAANRPLSSDQNGINHQFDRIFADSNSEDDHIVQFTEFSISAVRNGRNINDFTIGEEDGKEVELAGLGKVLYN